MTSGTDLIVTSNLDDPDGFYEVLLEAHQGLAEDASSELNARLVLILANHVGNRQVLAQALELALRHLPATDQQAGEA